MLEYLHIGTGTTALVAGSLAFASRKGAFLHRKSGLVFVITMLLMSLSGTLLAISNSEILNAIAGCLTFYLVATAFLAVHPFKKHGQLCNTMLMGFGLIIGVYGIYVGYSYLHSGTTVIDRQPIQILFVFSVISLIASTSDYRIIGTNRLRGKQKLIRHIWRVGLAMFIATASFFLGQSQVIPEAIRSIFVMLTPVLLVLFLTLYWLVRVQFWGLGGARSK